MSSKKGVIATVGILVLITSASFLIWLVPDRNIGSSIVISDYGDHIDIIDDQRHAMVDELSSRFSGVLDGSVLPQDYIESAQESSVIVKRQIAELLRSGADSQWHQSYGMYVESLRSLDEYISETIVISKLIASDNNSGNLDRVNAALASSEAQAMGALAAIPCKVHCF